MAQTGQGQLSIRLLVVLTGCWFLAQMGYYAQAQLFGPVMERYGLDEAQIREAFGTLDDEAAQGVAVVPRLESSLSSLRRGHPAQDCPGGR